MQGNLSYFAADAPGQTTAQWSSDCSKDTAISVIDAMRVAGAFSIDADYNLDGSIDFKGKAPGGSVIGGRWEPEE